MSKIKELKPIMDEVLRRKEELAGMPPQYENVSDNTIVMQLTPWRVQLIEVYAKSLTTSLDHSIDDIRRWGSELSEQLVKVQLPLDVGLHEIAYYRNTIGEIIRDEAENQDMSFADFYHIVSQFNAVVDEAVQIVSRSYMKSFHNSIEAAKYAIDELSVPVVQLTNDIGVIPIIGEVDTKRAQYLMSNALEKSAELQLRMLILDLSGVSVVDTMVAGQIFKVMDSLRLIGVEAVLSGVRPEVAQTMVNLGIRVEGKVYRDLRTAVEEKKMISK
ncbi:STAS domain-containing protein [Geomicrobium sediminis]|uniref:RsbT co-antagonist protein RsbR n=1 Tax=Geomicrobium sediminis TaxID=1347788 RepID=A0ABS2PCP7_9BACL|nr:STAS domain-containing protein [Geomicrobium sediminis]MBM7633204.1 rsbT co-antagonist protein RsbR [Geomicrobium sediminis]